MTGIDRVCLAYLRHFGVRAHAVVQHPRVRRVLDARASDRLFALLGDRPADFRRALVGGALRHGLAPTSRGDDRLYLNVGHTGLDDPGYAAWVREAGVRPVHLLHDLIPITHPQFCRPGEAARHRLRVRTMLKGHGIIANSRATLDALESFARDEGIEPPPSLAAWLGGAALHVPRDIAAPGRPTFVVLGTIEGRKNHLLLLDIWTDLVARLGDDAPRLLIVGQRGWEAEEVFARLDRDARLRGHVAELGDCSDADLARHLASARALLFPSMAEGYGLPLVEALGAGVPAIASNLPVFREIAGDVPDYVGPFDDLGWRRAILRYAETDSPARSAQIARLTDYQPPGWSLHFERVEAWLRTLRP